MLFLGTTFPRRVNEDLVEAINLFDPKLVEEANEAQESANLNTLVAAKIMTERRRWKHDEDFFDIGDKVLLRNDTDENASTRAKLLYDHLSLTICKWSAKSRCLFNKK